MKSQAQVGPKQEVVNENKGQFPRVVAGFLKQAVIVSVPELYPLFEADWNRFAWHIWRKTRDDVTRKYQAAIVALQTDLFGFDK